MSSIEARPRLMAVCDDCGSAYAAVEQSDGRIAPIGRLNGCACGSTEFSEYGTAPDADAGVADD